MREPFDRDAVLARFEHDVDLVREMVRLFRESSAAWLEELRADLARGELQHAVRVAHTLKGSVGNFLAGDAAAAAARLEKACRAGDAAEAQTAFGTAEAETNRLNAALNSLLAS